MVQVDNTEIHFVQFQVGSDVDANSTRHSELVHKQNQAECLRPHINGIYMQECTKTTAGSQLGGYSAQKTQQGHAANIGSKISLLVDFSKFSQI